MMDGTHLQIPYELRIGVTGHRKLKDAAAIAESVQRALDSIAHTLGASQVPLRWTVVSPLAKGADRIVAREILQSRRGRLEVIAPFGLDEYRKDFTSGADRDEFEELLESADDIVELNKDLAPDAQATTRKYSYLDVGKAVVRSCEILIAIWDGEPAEGIGGTGDIVRHALKQGRKVIWISSKSPKPAPRLLKPLHSLFQPALRLIRNRWMSPRSCALPVNAKDLSSGYHQLTCFLRDSTVPAPLIEEARIRESRKLREYAMSCGIPSQQIEPVIECILPCYVRTELLAMTYQRRHFRASRAVLYLSASAVTAAVFQVLFYPAAHALASVEILAMLAALILFATNRRQAWHEKWMHDRYLCEHMRTALYTTPLGLERTGASNASDTLPFYAGPKSWLATTVHHIVQTTRTENPKTEDLKALRRYLIDGWLAEQQSYHTKNEKTKQRSHRRRRWAIYCLFWGTLCMATLHGFGIGYSHASFPITTPGMWFTFFAISLPAWAAAVHAVDRQFEYERVAARSHQMSLLLEMLVAEAEEASTLEELRDVAGRASVVMGLENYEWTVLLSFDPPEMPA